MNNNAEICEFIHHLFGTQDFVPLSAPKFIGNEKKYLNECIDTTFVSSVGAFVDRFEHDMAVYTGAKRLAPVYTAISCSKRSTKAPTLDTKVVSIHSLRYFFSFPINLGALRGTKSCVPKRW